MRIKECGKGYQKRRWKVEWKPACEIYIKTSVGFNIIDHMVKQSQIQLALRKCWMSSKLHMQAWVVTSACTVYMECASGEIIPEWEIEDPINFPVLRVS